MVKGLLIALGIAAAAGVAVVAVKAIRAPGPGAAPAAAGGKSANMWDAVTSGVPALAGLGAAWLSSRSSPGNSGGGGGWDASTTGLDPLVQGWM
jgi:hypothetical protein